MKDKIIFKSQEGKQKILDYYNNILQNVDFEYKENYADTKYGKTYLLEAGIPKNPTVFLLHGSCSNSAMWYGDIGMLSDKFHVFSIDILGEPGKSQPNRLELNSDDHACWINELMEKLNIDKAVLIGNSLGGWIAQKFAVNYPDKVSKLVLIAPSGIVPNKLSFVLKSIFYAMQGETGMKKIGKLITGMDELPDAVIEFNKLIAAHFNPIIGALPVFSDEQLSKMNMPVLYMAGEFDVTSDTKKAVKRLKNSLKDPSINIVKNNGHVIYDTMKEVIPFIDG